MTLSNEPTPSIFDVLNDWIRETEGSIVNLLSAFAPWLAPLAPAYMTYQHAVGVLSFPVWIAAPVALVVEILGFSTVSTFMAFYFFNRRNKSEGKKAPIFLVVLSFAFYLSLIIFSNVLLDTFPSSSWAIIAVRALFTLQTFPAAVIVAVRTQHRDLLEEIASENRQKVSEKLQKVSETIPQDGESLPKDWRRLKPRLSQEEIVQLSELSTDGIKVIAKKYHVEEKTVYNWRSYAQEELRKQNDTNLPK